MPGQHCAPAAVKPPPQWPSQPGETECSEVKNITTHFQVCNFNARKKLPFSYRLKIVKNISRQNCEIHMPQLTTDEAKKTLRMSAA